MSNWPAAILFDFDGVIVNSEPLHFQAFRDTLAREHIHLTEEEYFRDLIGFDDRGAIKHLYAKHGRPLDAQTFQHLLLTKSKMMDAIIHERRFEALPGVKDLIRALSRNYPLAICSGALRHEIESMLDGIDLRDCFPIIVAAEDVTIGKPNPEGYLLAARLLAASTGRQFTPADCLIIEDAPTVIRSVRQAGFSVLAVASSYPPDDLHEANFVVKHLHRDEVQKMVPQLKITT